MPDEQTNASDTEGEKVDTPKEEVEETSKTEPKVVKQAREERERLEQLLEQIKQERAHIDNVKAEIELSGQTEIAKKPKPEKLSDVEYTKKLQKGEVNPLKEDGFE